MLEELKERVLKANLELVKYGLVVFTWGNASEIDREKGIIAIKPSGVPYEGMTAQDIALVDMDGKTVEGRRNPSSDTPTHVELYRHFPSVGGIVHTHSAFATAFAQAGRSVPAYGTTHADYFHGDVPCTRALTQRETDGDYEKNTGLVIAEAFRSINESAVPACVVKNHGPFAWGKDAAEAVYHAVVLEECARIALYTETLRPGAERAQQYLLDRHYERKHGINAYYGQKEEEK